jgi:hypothetical protein
MAFDKSRIAAKLKRKAAGDKLNLKKGIQDVLSRGLKNIKPAGGLTGTDKLNQLILEQTSKLQTLATDQIANITEEFGIVDIATDNPKVNLISNSRETKLPEIPSSLNTPTPKLTISPVEVPIKEINKAPTLIKDQFIEQIKPTNFDSLPQQAKRQVLEELETEAFQLSLELLSNKPLYCPSDDRLQRILKIYNNLLSTAESTATVLNYIAVSLNILTGILNGTTTALAALNIAKTAANQAAKIVPVLPGIVVSTITDLEDSIKILTFKADGSSKIVKVKGQLESGAYYTALAAGVVNTIVLLLKTLKPLLESCGLQPDDLGTQTQNFIKENEIKNQSNTQESYQGFTFEIVEVNLPNDPTVKRTIAQAINTEGIVALETQPSFTQNPKILIEELKLLIDKDNLKAY